MTTYLLLRDNKESGPYSFEGLKEKGLKPYDLVWVDGKSAAWRYPSEIEEFKSFAPAVEEQPFDRFFKKPAQNSSPILNSQSLQNGSPVQNNPSVVVQSRPAAPILPGEPSTVPGKRIIYVTLPAGKSVPALRPASPSPESVRSQSVLPVQQPAVQHPVARVESLPAAIKPSMKRSTPLPAPEEKFAQGRDDMWKSPVEFTPRPPSSAWKHILQPVAAVVSILVLLAAGIFIGLSINRDSFGFSQKPVSREAALTPVLHTEHQVSAGPVSGSGTSTVDPASSAAKQVAVPVTQTALPQNPAVVNPPASTPVATLQPAADKAAGSGVMAVTQRKNPNPPKLKPVVVEKYQAPASSGDSVATGLQVVHREALHRGDEPLGKDAIKSNIANLLSVGSNTYMVGTFGGISGLQLTVSNRSIYPIDLVVVEVDYVQSNKKVFKTENLYFRGIGPGSALMQEAPKSARGIKVQYRITLINSKDLGLSFSAL